MRIGLILSITVSVLLVGGAIWYRAHQKPVEDPNLVAVEKNLGVSPDDELGYFLSTASTTNISAQPVSTSATAKPTATEALGQQLLTDYLSSTAQSNGNADLSSVAQKYIDAVPSLLSEAPSIGTSDLNIVPSSPANLQSYAGDLQLIFQGYTEAFQGIDAPPSSSATSVDPSFYPVFSKMHDTYQKIAGELESMPVPATMASEQVKIINIYLQDAWASQALTNSQVDPAKAFAGLIALHNNEAPEQNTLDEISQILTANGL